MTTTRLPFPERVLHQHIATLGKTGSGKSSAMRVIAEHLLDKNRRVAIVDPKGDWWGLKSSANGRGAGYPVIMFGDFKEPRATDVPINPDSGPHVAELIATGNRPCVVGFRGWMPNDMMQFWIGKDSNQAGFAQSLFNANEGELYVLIDEVHNFAPKGKTLDVQSGRSVHWTNRIMSEGRGLGLTFFIASQRPQKVHNDTLDNCETLIAMRVTHPRSREAAEEWINAKGDKALAKEVLGTLAELKRGEAWAWSPENEFGPKRVQFPMFTTFDSFAPPQLQKKVSSAGWSEINLDQVREKLAAVIEEAKANDPKELKAEVHRLRSELAKKQSKPVPTPPLASSGMIERAIAAAAKKRDAAWLGSLRDLQRQIERTFADGTKRLAGEIQAIAFTAPNSAAIEIPPAPPQQFGRTSEAAAIARKPLPMARWTQEAPSSGTTPKIGDLHQKIAGILAAYYPDPVRTDLLASMCGKTLGGGWNGRLSEARQAGLLEDVARRVVRATEAAAKQYAGTWHRPTTTEEAIAVWDHKLSDRHRAMLNRLIEAHGEPVHVRELIEAAGMTAGGAFNGRLSELRSTGLALDVSKGFMKANLEALFLEGARKYG